MKRFLLSAIILLFPLAVLSCNKTPEGGDTPEEKVPAVPTGVRLHSATTTSPISRSERLAAICT